MRLQRYLNEKKKKLKPGKGKRIDVYARIKKAERIVSKGIKQLNSTLSKYKWNVQFNHIISIMNDIWGSDRISFVHDNGETMIPELKGNKYVPTGCCYESGEIEIGITLEFLNFISKPKNRENFTNLNNNFNKEFIKALGHELVHRSQFLAFKELMSRQVDHIDYFKGDDYDQWKLYMSKSHEMLAYAQDAAYEVYKGNTPYYCFMGGLFAQKL